MKTLKYFAAIFLLLSLQQLYAQDYNCITASIQEVAAESRGRWLPSEGNLNVLIVFAEFPDDNYDVNNPKWVKGSAPQNMSGWVDQTWTATPTQGSLTHFFNEMSGSRLHFTGKVVHAIAPHARDWYITNYPYYGRGYATKDIIQGLDATWNFAEFDNWDFVSDYNHTNTADTYVDMIIFVWRNIEKDMIDKSYYLNQLNFTSNFGDLGYAGDVNVDGGLRKVKTDYGGYSSIPFGSGVTVRNYLTEDPFRNSIHEFTHYLIGGNDFHNGFGFWGMLSAYGIRSYVANSFERYRLGWVADSTSYTVNNTTQTLTGRTLSDFVTGRNAYRFVINTSPQEYFFIENHQKTSYWENNAPFWGSQDGTVENGIYVIRKVGTPNQTNPSSWLQLIPADGRFNWGVNQSVTNPWGSGQLPVFKQLVPNKDSGYHDNQWIPFSYGGLTSPQPIFYTELYGYPIQDIRFHGDGKDAYRMDYNQVFSQWSNPNNQRTTSQTTPFGFEITNFSNGVYTLNIYVNTSQNASPSKPQNLSAQFIGSHPQITWDANQETDVGSYELSRFESLLGWEVIATLTGRTNTTYTDNEVYSNPHQTFTYRARAMDQTYKYSVYSETASVMGTLGKENYSKNNFEVSTKLNLVQNYPNPFNPSTKISFSIPQKSQIKLKIFDVLGREVANLVDGVYEVGKYEVTFDAGKLSSGVYFYNLTTGNNSISKKMLLVK